MTNLLVCDDDAWQKISTDIGADEVESLPLDVSGSRYHVLNVLNTIDSLDKDRSKFQRSPIDGHIIELLLPVFSEELLRGICLFRVPEQPIKIFATGAFKQMVEDHRLTGLEFVRPTSPLEGIAQLIKQGFVPPAG